MNFIIKIYAGKNILPWADTISEIRVNEFKNFPYLYKGDVNLEKEYLTTLSRHEHGLVTIAFQDNAIAGMFTAAPLTSINKMLPNYGKVFAKNNLRVEDYYYFGDCIVLPQYRNFTIVKKLFFAAKESAIAWGYSNGCGITVDREQDHPLKPNDYKDLDILWEKFGFVKSTMKVVIEWPTFTSPNHAENKENTCSIWLKNLQK